MANSNPIDLALTHPQDISLLIGSHIRDLRLRGNLSRAEIAARSQLSLTALRNLENGKGTLNTFVAALRCLDPDSLNQIIQTIAPPTHSPMALLRQQQDKRQRAGSRRPRKTQDH